MKGLSLQGVVRQLRRNRAAEVARREHEPELERRRNDEQRRERQFHHAEHR